MKVWNYMMIMLTLIIFLSFLGVTPTGSESLLNDTGIQINTTTGGLTTGDVVASTWYGKLFGTGGFLIALLTGGAIIVGFFTRQFEWKIVLLPFFTGLVIKFVAMGWSIIQVARDTGAEWLVAVIATIFLPLTIMFVFSIVEWFGGAGTQ